MIFNAIITILQSNCTTCAVSVEGEKQTRWSFCKQCKIQWACHKKDNQNIAFLNEKIRFVYLDCIPSCDKTQRFAKQRSELKCRYQRKIYNLTLFIENVSEPHLLKSKLSFLANVPPEKCNLSLHHQSLISGCLEEVYIRCHSLPRMVFRVPKFFARKQSGLTNLLTYLRKLTGNPVAL